MVSFYDEGYICTLTDTSLMFKFNGETFDLSDLVSARIIQYEPSLRRLLLTLQHKHEDTVYSEVEYDSEDDANNMIQNIFFVMKFNKKFVLWVNDLVFRGFVNMDKCTILKMPERFCRFFIHAEFRANTSVDIYSSKNKEETRKHMLAIWEKVLAVGGGLGGLAVSYEQKTE